MLWELMRLYDWRINTYCPCPLASVPQAFKCWDRVNLHVPSPSRIQQNAGDVGHEKEFTVSMSRLGPGRFPCGGSLTVSPAALELFLPVPLHPAFRMLEWDLLWDARSIGQSHSKPQPHWTFLWRLWTESKRKDLARGRKRPNPSPTAYDWKCCGN